MHSISYSMSSPSTIDPTQVSPWTVIGGEIHRIETAGMSSSSTRTVALRALPTSCSSAFRIVTEISPSPSFSLSACEVSATVLSVSPGANVTVVCCDGPLLRLSRSVGKLMIFRWPDTSNLTDRLSAVRPTRLKRNTASAPSVTVACTGLTETVVGMFGMAWIEAAGPWPWSFTARTSKE